MILTRQSLLLAISFLLTATFSPAQTPTWRSAYYPENWTPDFHTADGKFLHDFSYAGYHRAEKELPKVTGKTFDVTQAPYLADATGAKDSTAAIQAALNDAGKAGGGIVFLPAGSYKIAPPTPESMVAIQIPASNIVLRGAGEGKTFIFTDAVAMRNKHLIQVRNGDVSGAGLSANLWYQNNPQATSLLTADLPFPTTKIPVKDVSPFAVGDLIAVRSDVTPRFIEMVGMTGKWVSPLDAAAPKNAGYQLRGVLYCRRVVAVDSSKQEITIDAPTRFALPMADNARVVKLTEPTITEVGLEDFSIGMKQNPKPGWETAIPRLNQPPVDGQNIVHVDSPDWNDGAFDITGTPAYDVHQSYAIGFKGAENCWMQRVNTYAPEGNTGVHILSNMLLLEQSRYVTIDSCDFKFSQYQGGGGNGYLYVLHSQECLIRNCIGEGGRHNIDFGTMHSSGNVILNCTIRDSKLPSDFHMYFSAANLLDGTICEKDSLEANFRPYGGVPMHGVTTTESVFWNTLGNAYPREKMFFDGHPAHRKQVAVDSHQWGQGYVIGTRGPASAVDSDNNVEGAGKGDTLEPQSLYQDQLARRLKAQGAK